MSDAALTVTVASARAVLFDFDGPVCSVFSSFLNTQVADHLRAHLRGLGVTVPLELAAGPDIFDVFRFAAGINDDVRASAEAELRRCELRAVESAAPTPDAHETIRACHRSGRPVAMVSNNANDAIHRYLDLHGLADHVDAIASRSSADPAELKPDPCLVDRALSLLAVRSSAAVFVGDAVTDIQAARAAGTLSIGYANKPGKVARLGSAGADALITDMRQLTDALALTSVT